MQFNGTYKRETQVETSLKGSRDGIAVGALASHWFGPGSHHWPRISIESMYSHVQQPCNFTGTEESVYIGKELFKLSQDWFDFIVFQHQYNCQEVMCIHSLCGLSLHSVLLWFLCGFSVFFFPPQKWTLSKFQFNMELCWRSVGLLNPIFNSIIVSILFQKTAQWFKILSLLNN